jgi:hypothetical protein
MKHSDEGMGLSVAVYAIAMMCGLALFVLPVMWANGARVYDNPGVAAAHLPGGPIRADNRSEYPLASLHTQQIVSPAMLAELNTKARKEKPAVRHASRPALQHYAQADREDEAPTPHRRRGFFLFSLF